MQTVAYRPTVRRSLLALALVACLGTVASAQYPAGTGSAAHDMDDDTAALLLHIQQNHSTLTTLTSLATTLSGQGVSFHDFVHDVENNKNNRTIGETPCEFHYLVRAFFATGDEVTSQWSTLSTDTAFVGLWNTVIGDGAKLAALLLPTNPRLAYLFLKSTESLTHKIDDEAAAILLYLQQNHATETTAISLAQTFANTAAAYHSFCHDVGKCQKPFTGVKAEYAKLQNDMFTLGIELVNRNLIPNDNALFGLTLGLVGYYTAHSGGLLAGGLL